MIQMEMLTCACVQQGLGQEGFRRDSGGIQTTSAHACVHRCRMHAVPCMRLHACLCVHACMRRMRVAPCMRWTWRDPSPCPCCRWSWKRRSRPPPYTALLASATSLLAQSAVPQRCHGCWRQARRPPRSLLTAGWRWCAEPDSTAQTAWRRARPRGWRQMLYECVAVAGCVVAGRIRLAPPRARLFLASCYSLQATKLSDSL